MMADNIVWMDFNDAPDQSAAERETFDAKELKAHLIDRLPEALAYLFPNGKYRGKQFIVGDLQGNAGKSLVVDLQDQKAGMWIDFATSEGGDVLDLWAQANGMDSQRNFPQVMESIARWLGEAPLRPVQPVIKKEPVDELGHGLPSGITTMPTVSSSPVFIAMTHPIAKSIGHGICLPGRCGHPIHDRSTTSHE